MLHWSVPSSIFYYTQLFCGLWLMCYSGATGWEEKERQSSTFFYDAKKELEMLWDEKVEISRRSFIPFSSSSLTDLLFFGQNATQHLQTIFVCVCPHFISSCLTVSNFNKSFLCVILHPTYPSIFILHPPFPTYRLHGGILRCTPFKSSLKWLVSDQ